MRLTRKWPEDAAVAALRDIDAVSHKKHRLACRRINQCFLKIFLFILFSVHSVFPAKLPAGIRLISEKICELFPPARLTTVTALSAVFHARFPKIAQNIVTQASVMMTVIPHGREELQRPFRFFLLLCQGLSDS